MLPKTGDVYCVFVEKLNKYTACQITKVYHERLFKNKLRAILLELDWTGIELPSEDELNNMKPLYCDYMFWNNKIVVYSIPAKVPIHFKYVGNIQPLFDKDSNVYSSARNVGQQIYNQSRWLQIPEELRNKFKQAQKSDEKITFMERELNVSSNSIDDSIDDFEKAEELAAFPCLKEIRCEKWHDNIIYFLKKIHLLARLT